MTPDDARRCAIAIADTWPYAKIIIDRWIEPLERHDLEQARAVYRWFRDHADHAPTVAQFHAKVRELYSRNTGRLIEPCALCDGLGWEQINPQRPGHPHPTTGVVPCRCSNGRANEDAHRRACDDNDGALHRQRPGVAA